MESNFYKALDTKSNFTKILERKKLINKNLIKELKKQAMLNKKNSNELSLVNSIADKH